MSRAETSKGQKAAFRQSDVTRALQGARKAGFDVGRAEIGRDGKIVLVARGETPVPQNDLDRWLDQSDAH